MKKSCVLVTGGAGFIGSHLVERLAQVHRVRIVDDFSTGSRDNLSKLKAKENVEVIEGDVRDAALMSSVSRNVDVVFHLAVSCLRTSLNHPKQSHEVNAGGTLQVCLAARDANVRRLVYVSSSEVYGTAQCVPMSESHPTEPLTVYGAAKLAGELYVKAFQRTYELPIVIVRPFNTYGPREPWSGMRAEVIPRFILQCLTGQSPVVFGDGRQTRDFTFVADTVEGILLASNCDSLIGRSINIGTGRETCINDIAQLCAELIGKGLRPTHQPARPGDVSRHRADVRLAGDLLGFQARTDLRSGLVRTIDWFRSLTEDLAAVAGCAGVSNW